VKAKRTTIQPTITRRLTGKTCPVLELANGEACGCHIGSDTAGVIGGNLRKEKSGPRASINPYPGVIPALPGHGMLRLSPLVERPIICWICGGQHGPEFWCKAGAKS